MTVRRRRAEALAAARVEIAPGERWQHGQDEFPAIHPRMPTSVASGVALLARSKAIGDSEVIAADRFNRDYIYGIEGVRDPLGAGGRSGASDAHNGQFARAAAVGRYREIADTIGPLMTSWLVSFVVFDLSFCAMQAQFMPGPLAGRTEMRGRMTTVLILLSRLYAAIDRRRRKDHPVRPLTPVTAKRT